MSPGPATASAVPERLEGYAGAALDLDEALQRAGAAVQDALDRFAAQPSDVPVRVEPLGAELVALGRAAAQLDTWTGRVGVAFRLADQGAAVLRLLLSLLGAPFDPVRARPDWSDEQVAAALEALLGLDPARDLGSIVQPLVAPDPVRAFVASLTPAQREALVERHPELVGPVDGMPHELRYRANRALVDRALERARAVGDADLVASLERLDGDDRQLLFFDPSGDGRVAEVFGDLATAEDVVVFVPGVTNTMASFGATRDNARHIYDEMGRLDPGGSHAAIAWLGYDTPGLVDAPLPGRAHGAAPLLRQLWDGLALPDAVNTTLVGHSYGSLVSATALRDGFRGVDNLVVVGSPGLQAGDLDDLDLADGMRFFSARAPFDTLVGSTESYGRDPSDWRFGGTRFETGEGPGGFVTGHSAYTTIGSESLRNLARIGLGRFDAVTTIEPTAADRVVGGVDDVHDVVVEGPVDLLQWADDRLDDLVHGGIDRAQVAVPLGPVDGWIDDLQAGAEVADRYGDAAVDAVQRVTSPDFWGDVVGDWFAVDGPGRLWDAGTDLVDAGLDRGRELVDAGLEQGERVLDATGDALDAGLDRGRELLDDAGDALDRGVDEAGDALGDLYDGTLGRIPGL